LLTLSPKLPTFTVTNLVERTEQYVLQLFQTLGNYSEGCRPGCQSPCRACGGDHAFNVSPVCSQMCRCSPVPCHTEAECSAFCRQGLEEDDGWWADNDITDCPLALRCGRHCAPCGLPRNHAQHDNTKRLRPYCELCVDDDKPIEQSRHFTQDCPKLLCPGDACNTAFSQKGRQCKGHCRKCGELDLRIVGSEHHCQRTKKFGLVFVGTRHGQPVLMPGWIFHDKKNPEYGTSSAMETDDI